MEIIEVVPRGYCKGVVKAIMMAKQARIDYPNRDIYILGMLVHNQYVIDALSALGIHTIDDSKTTNRYDLVKYVPNNCVLIFSAHGISDQIKQACLAKGCTCIDASCSDVLKTINLVKEKINEGYKILYIGKANHPEAQAVLSISNQICFITKQSDIDQIKAAEKMFVTNQTTMSQLDLKQLFADILVKFPHAIIMDEICNATYMRQKSIMDLANQNIDVLYVVGDKKSNNSNRLASIAKSINIPAIYLIDDVSDVKYEQVKKANKIAISSGASTPTYLTNQVITYLKNIDETSIPPMIDINKII